MGVHTVDVIVIGAGAAGMMCAARAAEAGRQVMLIDHAEKLAEKIRISGGGRCNFTNRQVSYHNFVSENPQFSRAALSTFTPQDFIAMVERHGIAWHEKHRGQLFCDGSSEQIIDMLKHRCDQANVRWRRPCKVISVSHHESGFELQTSGGLLKSAHVVIATGGTAVPQVGATDFGLKIARQFGIRVVNPRPALVPLQFDPQQWQPFANLAGVGLEVSVALACGKCSFDEDILFTHRGLSGPGILQISSYWQPGTALQINLLPGSSLEATLQARKDGTRQQMDTVLAQYLPRRLAQQWLGDRATVKIAQWSNRSLKELGQQLQQWVISPSGTAGLRKAEVMGGGVATDELDQRSLMSKRVPNLYFIGEVVDMTGWLGGYNFQWAWASGVACALALASR